MDEIVYYGGLRVSEMQPNAGSVQAAVWRADLRVWDTRGHVNETANVDRGLDRGVFPISLYPNCDDASQRPPIHQRWSTEVAGELPRMGVFEHRD